MIRSFLFGAITGGLVTWFWHEEIREFVARKTRTARSKAADGLQSVEEGTERLLDRTSAPLRRAEELLDETKTKIGERLRAGQDAIRPSAPRDSTE